MYVGLWHILTGYGYQMISEDQKEAEVVKDSHVVTLVVSAHVSSLLHWSKVWHKVVTNVLQYVMWHR